MGIEGNFGTEGEHNVAPDKDTETQVPVGRRSSGKFGKLGRAFAMVGAFAAGSGLAAEASAGDAGGKAKQEDTEKKGKIDESKLTESGKWARSMIEAAKAELRHLETAEDAEAFVSTHFTKFVSEFYMPTKGNVKDGPYGTKSRVLTWDDARLVAESAVAMREILVELNTKFPVEAYDKRLEQVDDMVTKSAKRSTYAGQKQAEMLEGIQ